jgi:hypothetical protein
MIVNHVLIGHVVTRLMEEAPATAREDSVMTPNNRVIVNSGASVSSS